ncbi:MAG: hypothetical protein K0S07_858 [Chlamydiales bacterium]|jgi:hypothetical protein|nr:hypothetical protein [Chlamydiales bacterium]
MAADTEQTKNPEENPALGLPEELRGLIIDEEQATSNWVWAGTGLVILILVLSFSWAYVYLTKSDSQILQEKLENLSQVRYMLSKASSTIDLMDAQVPDLQEAVQSLAPLLKTPLKVSDAPLANVIPERNLSLYYMLKGLLKIAVEGKPLNPDNERFIQKTLADLESTPLIYFEGGIKKQTPLSFSTQADRNEAMSIVQAAYCLGTWYRFQNDRDMAKNCFELGRSYVEGYRIATTFYSGYRPSKINAVWKSYASCMEGLAEFAIDDEQYRLARSYLSRLYQTPSPAQYSLWQSILKSPLNSDDSIKWLEQDLKVLKEASLSIEKLSSFPEYSLDETINWGRLFDELKSAQFQDKTLVSLIARHLPAATLEQMQKNQTLEEGSKRALLTVLNSLLYQDNLSNDLFFEREELSPRANTLLEQAKVTSLNETETSFLNREIIDKSLQDFITYPFILSDGSYLTNRLSPKEIEIFSTFCQDRISKPGFSREKKEALQTCLEKIQEGKEKPSLQDFKQLIDERQSLLEAKIAKIEDSLLSLAAEKKKLNQESLQQNQSIDVAHVLNLKDNLRDVEQAFLAARFKKAKALQEWDYLQKLKNELGEEIRQQLARTHKKYHNLLKEQAEPLTAEEENPFKLTQKKVREQIDQYIALKSKFITLLEDLNRAKESPELKAIEEKSLKLTQRKKQLLNDLAKAEPVDQEKIAKSLLETEREEGALLQELQKNLSPLSAIIEEIAHQEETIWDSEKLLKETRSEIQKLIGDPQVLGSLEEKSQRRAFLLTATSEMNALLSPIQEAEIAKLNDEIEKDQEKLQILLATEQIALESLNLFFASETQNKGLFRKGDLSILREHLNRQRQLLDTYQHLCEESRLHRALLIEESALFKNLKAIDEVIGERPVFSEATHELLTRYMQAAIQAKNRQLDISQKLKALKESTASFELNTAFGRGYNLDLLEMFQMEHQMGISVTKYREAFEDYGQLIDDIKSTLKSKELLDEQKLQALRKRDQIEIDRLLPQIADKELALQTLLSKQMEQTSKLKKLYFQFENEAEAIAQYRQTISASFDKLQQKLDEIKQEIASQDTALSDIAQKAFGSFQDIRRAIAKFSLDQYAKLDEVISRQKENLKEMNLMKESLALEELYQTKALFLIAQTLLLQSASPTFESLQKSNAISADWLELEKKIGRLPYEEFSGRYVFHKVETPKPKDDQQSKDNKHFYDSWIAALEEEALQIFKSPLIEEATFRGIEIGKLTSPLDQERFLFISKAKYSLGEIHMKRALNYIRTSALKPAENPMAVRELDRARSEFALFLQLAALLQPSKQMPNLLEEPLNKDDFPQAPLVASGWGKDASIYLGVIAHLKGNYLESIAYYRAILSELLNEAGKTSLQGVENSFLLKALVDPQIAKDHDPLEFAHTAYATIFAKEPLAAEVVYRIARAYDSLYQEEVKRIKQLESLNIPMEELPALSDIDKLAEKAIAYYTEIIGCHADSPFREASLLKRSQLLKDLKNYPLARQDLVRLLNADSIGGSLNQADMMLRGDLPGELKPSFAHISFELGKLYLAMNDYQAAGAAFLRAKENDPSGLYELRARIAYADSLFKDANWLMAAYFYQQLIDESLQAPPDKKWLYSIDLNLNLAKSYQELGAFESALKAYNAICQQAPPMMRQESGVSITLDALSLLSYDYRDFIRPLAEALQGSADILLMERQFVEAKKFYNQAGELFKILPWTQDRFLRTKSREEWASYRRLHLLESAFGPLKADVIKTFDDAYSTYRKEMMNAASLKNDLGAILSSIDRSLEPMDDEQERTQQMIGRMSAFRDQIIQALPETAAKMRAEERRRSDLRMGGQNVLQYDALYKIYTLLAENLQGQKMPLSKLAALINRDSLEGHLLNTFVFEYASKRNIDASDIRAFDPLKTNIGNIASLEQADTRFNDFVPSLLAWVEGKMAESPFDVVMIPVSLESSLIEDVDLYLVALLSLKGESQDANEIYPIVDRYLLESQKITSRLTKKENIVDMAYIAALTAESLEQWQKSEKYYRYLIANTSERSIGNITGAETDSYLLGLARSLMQSADQQIQNSAFIAQGEDSLALEQAVSLKRAEARKLLEQVTQSKKNDATHIINRILAKKLLNQLTA